MFPISLTNTQFCCISKTYLLGKKFFCKKSKTNSKTSIKYYEVLLSYGFSLSSLFASGTRYFSLLMHREIGTF